MKQTAADIYNALQSEGILDSQGTIVFSFADIDVQIKRKDVIGNIIEEWLQKWLEVHNIDFIHNESQNPPDFYLDPDDKTHNLLEVKVFDYNNAPGFDIGDFKMYAKEIVQKPYMLHSDYLIFGYSMNDGKITIDNIWLKKVWEITRRGKDSPLFLQVKNGTIHKIRPAKWYSNQRVDFKVFDSLEHFVSAIDETMHTARDQMGDIDTRTWLSSFKVAYRKQYSKTLSIPRWDDISESYDLKLEKQRMKAISARDKALQLVQAANETVSGLEEQVKKSQTEKQRETAITRLEKAQLKLKILTDKLEEKQHILDSI